MDKHNRALARAALDSLIEEGEAGAARLLGQMSQTELNGFQSLLNWALVLVRQEHRAKQSQQQAELIVNKKLSKVRSIKGRDAFLLIGTYGREYYSTAGLPVENGRDMEWEVIEELGTVSTPKEFAALTKVVPLIWTLPCPGCGALIWIEPPAQTGHCPACRRHGEAQSKSVAGA